MTNLAIRSLNQSTQYEQFNQLLTSKSCSLVMDLVYLEERRGEVYNKEESEMIHI